jgi:hypothetical protein
MRRTSTSRPANTQGVVIAILIVGILLILCGGQAGPQLLFVLLALVVVYRIVTWVAAIPIVRNAFNSLWETSSEETTPTPSAATLTSGATGSAVAVSSPTAQKETPTQYLIRIPKSTAFSEADVRTFPQAMLQVLNRDLVFLIEATHGQIEWSLIDLVGYLSQDTAMVIAAIKRFYPMAEIVTKPYTEPIFTAESTQDESKIRLLHWLNQTTRRLRN